MQLEAREGQARQERMGNKTSFGAGELLSCLQSRNLK